MHGPADFRSRHAAIVAAPPERCFGCVRDLDLGGSTAARMLLAARGLRKMRSIDDLVAAGFVVVEDDAPRALALALVAKPWLPGGGIVALEPQEVEPFAEPGFVKVLWRFEMRTVAPGTEVSTTTEIWATDETARRRFGRYWRLVRPGSGLLRRGLLASIKRCAEGPAPG